QARADREEVLPVLPLLALLRDQAQEGLVHERGRLQGVVPALAAEGPPGQAAQLDVDDREELVERFRLATVPAVEQPGQVFGHEPPSLPPGASDPREPDVPAREVVGVGRILAPGYSSLNTRIGSARLARRAGSAEATSAVASMAATAPEIATGSVNRTAMRFERRRPAAMATARPPALASAAPVSPPANDH